MASNDSSDAFKELLERNCEEQKYQEALELDPKLIPREFVQNHGVHMSLVLRKLRLAENYTTDFLYLSKSSADWNLVFIELEKPSTPYFRSKSDELHPEFLAGIDQIDRWRAWANNAGNIDHMLRETLEPIWHPTSMRQNPIYPKFVLVTGRRSEFEGDARKRGLVHAKERDDFKILSYDSLVDGYKHHKDLYLGVRLNSHIRIDTHKFVNEGTFVWIEPERLEISERLRDSILAERARWQYISKPGVMTLDERLPRIRITNY